MRKRVVGALILLVLGELSLEAYGKKEWYIGADFSVGRTQTTFVVDDSSIVEKPRTQMGMIKVGAQLPRHLRVQAILRDEKIFWKRTEKIYTLGVEMLKSLQLSKAAEIFLKVGVGAEHTKLHGDFETTSTFGISATVGAGVMIRVSEHIEMDLGLDIEKRSFGSVDSGETTVDLSDRLFREYVGFNYRF